MDSPEAKNPAIKEWFIRAAYGGGCLSLMLLALVTIAGLLAAFPAIRDLLATAAKS